MKEILKNILLKVRMIVFIAITISVSIAIILFFRFLGWKGLLGFAIGGLATGYVFMSENPFVKSYKEHFLK